MQIRALIVMLRLRPMAVLGAGSDVSESKYIAGSGSETFVRCIRKPAQTERLFCQPHQEEHPFDKLVKSVIALCAYHVVSRPTISHSVCSTQLLMTQVAAQRWKVCQFCLFKSKSSAVGSSWH